MLMNETDLIPTPKTYGPLGNLPLMRLDQPTQSLVELSKNYGDIFRMIYPGGRSEIYITTEELVADACDESRFDKHVWAPLQKVKPFAGDGLFTSETDEPNWQKAHHLLVPSFSQRAMQGYHQRMVDIALQLIQKWIRLNPDESVNVPDDMTRLTLDTIGLCGFNYRFNSFYREQPHPFISSMVRSLDEAMGQLLRVGIQDKLMIRTKRQFKQDIQTMFSLVDKIIAERKVSDAQDADDLLARMLAGKDPQTGEGLDDENIRYQIITFLIAGHETTSGLLSFAIYYLLKNAEPLKKAREEVDRVLTSSIPTYKQVLEMKYVRMVLQESLRMWPTAPAFSLYAMEDTLLAGKYPLKKDESVNVLTAKLHRDPKAWGEDADEFRPERFADQSKVPLHAYKPFGNGQRACIGQQFAMHEAVLVLSMILKHFELVDHTNYELKVKETLTLKPDEFEIQVKIREPLQLTPTHELSSQTAVQQKEDAAKIRPVLHGNPENSKHSLLVLHGSNQGTAESIAREMADQARQMGVNSRVASLQQAVDQLPTEGVVLIIAASYNGQPGSSARPFVDWLKELEQGALKGVRYAVFGCGDRTWASTYQAVPRWIDEQMSLKGAERFSTRGDGDMSEDFELQLEQWQESFWGDLTQALELDSDRELQVAEQSLKVYYVKGAAAKPITRAYQAFPVQVAENRELQLAGSGRSTRHIEIKLPEGITYQEGDHLGVIPVNSRHLINRVLTRFGLKGTDLLILSASGQRAAHLPLEQPVSAEDILAHSVELQEPATRTQLRELAAYTSCPPHKRELEALVKSENYETEILMKRLSMLDLLEKYPACEMPFEVFLSLLPALKARYYSISSSPLLQKERVSITVAVVEGPAWSGTGNYRGTASNYLAECQPGEEIFVFIRTPESGFQLPNDHDIPIIMVGPGTGVAPFRGFLQQRYAQKRQGVKLAEAHLYFGCRNDDDYIYREELEHYQEEGIVTLHTAFSRKEGFSCTYVQHLMQEKYEEMIQLLMSGGKLFICGDGTRMAPDVEHMLRSSYQQVVECSEEEAEQWLLKLQQSGQYAKDVWSGGKLPQE